MLKGIKWTLLGKDFQSILTWFFFFTKRILKKFPKLVSKVSYLTLHFQNVKFLKALGLKSIEMILYKRSGIQS